MEGEVPTEVEAVPYKVVPTEVPAEDAAATRMASADEGIVWNLLEEQLHFMIHSIHMDEIYDLLDYNADEDGASAAEEKEKFPAEVVAAPDEEAATKISEEVPARKVPTKVPDNVAAGNATAEDPAEDSQVFPAEPPEDEAAVEASSSIAEKVTTAKLDDEEKIPGEDVKAHDVLSISRPRQLRCVFEPFLWVRFAEPEEA